ncbi:hypothetical protein SH580_17320 [Coraliomargarita algicola]|uniref:Uncharacterized protein n=1 Tax=Coraliomargarita algicola TaxID=3092156 RepID=A0ABZ0RJN1_9BACT|nr:hypothetical protein [Coraliomargarita sp. J2-16]WPJ95185.1 hypothetical protein SH580_17320 [Coraliomargarita sp. J2-16]
MIKTPHPRNILALSAFTLAASTASADLLVYEGFNYGGSDTAINGIAVGGGAVGLTGSYATATGTSGSGNTQASTYLATGLSFSNLSTTGGSLQQSVIPKIDLTKEYVYSSVALDTSATGDIYGSMLVNIATSELTLGGDSSNSGISDLRVQDSSNLTGNANSSMLTTAKRASQAGVKAGASYTANGPISGSNAINTNQTYLFITRYTNVGLAGGGTANLWVLDETQYDLWQADGGSEIDLATYALMETSNSGTDTIAFDATKSIRVGTGEFNLDFNSGSANYSNLGELTVTYDEIRYGSTLGDVVVVVPESSQYSLILGALLACFVGARRRRA